MTLRKTVEAALLGVALATGTALPAPAAPEPTAAANPKAAEAFIKAMSDKAFAVLRDKSLNQSQREDKFRTLLGEGFELDFIGQSVLGLHRRTATPKQLGEFKAAFPDYVIKIYANRLTDYGNTSLKVMGVQPVGQRGDAVVRTQVTGGSVTQPVQADWRVRTFPGKGLRIIDLSIAGVSMAITQRDEFDAKIRARGLDNLIAELASPVVGKSQTARAAATAAGKKAQ